MLLISIRDGKWPHPSLSSTALFLRSYSCWARLFRQCDDTALTGLSLFARFFDDRTAHVSQKEPQDVKRAVEDHAIKAVVPR